MSKLQQQVRLRIDYTNFFSKTGDLARFFHYNHRGDCVMVTDEGGNILEEIEFNAYGEITGGGGNMPTTSISEENSNNLSGLENLFVGAYGIKYDGKTNLHYMRFRWYSNDQMRFLSPDLLLGINRYAYCDNNPVNFIDPLGLKGDTIVLFYQDPDKPQDNVPLQEFERKEYENHGITCREFNRENMTYALENYKYVLIMTHGRVGLHIGKPTDYFHTSKNHPFYGFYIRKDGYTDTLSPQEFCRIVKDLKNAGKLKTKYLFGDACASGNLPKSCKDFGNYVTYVGTKLPVKYQTFEILLKKFKDDRLLYHLQNTRILSNNSMYNSYIVYTNTGVYEVRSPKLGDYNYEVVPYQADNWK